MTVRRVTAVGLRTVEGALAAPDQLGALWRDLTELVRRAHGLMSRLDLLAARVERELDQVDGMLLEAHGVLADGADVALSGREAAAEVRSTRILAEHELQRVRALLDSYAPALEALAPLGREAAALLSPAHLRGLARLLDELPRLVDRLEPALDGMGHVAPHLEEVTERMESVGEVVEGLPGAKLLRRRGQARAEDEES